MTRAKSSKKSGQPRWTYVVGAAVAIGTLAWAVTSHFLSTAKQATRPPEEPRVSVTVPGPKSIGVGVMSGGQINQNIPVRPQERSDGAR